MILPPEIVKAITDWMKQFEGPGGFAGWGFRQLGGKKWLRERALHVPDAAVQTLGARSIVIEAEIRAQFSGLTPEAARWRSVEATLCEAVEQRIIKDIEFNLPALPIPGWKP